MGLRNEFVRQEHRWVSPGMTLSGVATQTRVLFVTDIDRTYELSFVRETSADPDCHDPALLVEVMIVDVALAARDVPPEFPGVVWTHAGQLDQTWLPVKDGGHGAWRPATSDGQRRTVNLKGGVQYAIHVHMQTPRGHLMDCVYRALLIDVE